MSLEVDSLVQKLQALGVEKKRTREELMLSLGGVPTLAALSLVGWAKKLGNTLKDALKPAYESAPYKWLCSFLGYHLYLQGRMITRPGGILLCYLPKSGNILMLRSRNVCLRESAVRIVCALKDSQLAATVQDYLPALESVYGATDSSEDLYYRFSHTYQEPQEQLLDFIRRLEDLLQQVVRKEGISTKHIDSASLDQILRGTRQNVLMWW
ncbi:paraneoplastic Ma antigen 1 [Chelydra serpentina]|uniref:Paraneoplastic Ma antigen 1 n=1 Tax=Chelydra serpentina TaxID=8475 RepID=A0A8T1T7H1_CHESE|nr:paraneoplastic Ma antigen 1 [Chelydra serpentina]